jgi:hypothetical protein
MGVANAGESIAGSVLDRWDLRTRVRERDRDLLLQPGRPVELTGPVGSGSPGRTTGCWPSRRGLLLSSSSMSGDGHRHWRRGSRESSRRSSCGARIRPVVAGARRTAGGCSRHVCRSAGGCGTRTCAVSPHSSVPDRAVVVLRPFRGTAQRGRISAVACREVHWDGPDRGHGRLRAAGSCWRHRARVWQG